MAKPSTIMRITAGVLLGGGVLAYLVSRTGIESLLAAYSEVTVVLLLASVCVLGLEVFLKSVRWAMVLRASAQRRIVRAFTATAIGFGGNIVMPARAGELIRVLIISRHNRIPRSLAMTTVAVTQLFDLLFLLSSSVALSVGLAGGGALVRPSLTAGLMVGTLAVVATLFAAQRYPDRFSAFVALVARRAPDALGKRLRNYAREFSVGLRLLGDGTHLMAALAMTLFIWGLEIGAVALALHAFHLPVDAGIVLALAVSTNLAFVVPLTPGNVGTYQVVCVVVLGLFGVAEASALSFSIGFQALSAVTVVSLAVVCWMSLGGKDRPIGDTAASQLVSPTTAARNVLQCVEPAARLPSTMTGDVADEWGRRG